MTAISPRDAISYDPPFLDNVQGQLMARFQTDAEGAPLFEEDEYGLRHYAIDVYLRSPRKAEIERVEYFMDDPSFGADPKAVSKNRAMDFKEEISSYGDVPVKVSVKIGSDVYEQRAWLSNMLANGYAEKSMPAIRSALQRLKVN